MVIIGMWLLQMILQPQGQVNLYIFSGSDLF